MQRSGRQVTRQSRSENVSDRALPQWLASGAPTLSGVVKALGPSVAHLVGGDDRANRPVSTLVLHDPLEEIRRVAEGVLLAVGVIPEGERWQELLGRADERGYVCVGVKSCGVSLQQLHDGVAGRRIAVAVVADEIPWEHFFALASSAMHHYYSPEQTLGNARLGDLFAVANAVAGAVGEATAIIDTRQSIIAYSAIDDQPIDETRRTTILGLRVPSNPATDRKYRIVHGAEDVVEMPSNNSDYPRLAVPIRAGGELLGSIWVIDRSGGADNAANRAALKHAADIAALHLLQARTESEVADRRRGDLLSAVLDDPAKAVEVAASLGIQGAEAVRIVAIGIASKSLTGDTVTAYHQILELVRLHCRAELGFGVATLRTDMLYLILPLASAEHGQNSLIRLLSGIDAHARRSYGYRLVMGLGVVVPGLAEAGKSMLQAARIVGLMRRDLRTTGLSGDGALIGVSEDLVARLALSGLAEHAGGLDEATGDAVAKMLTYDSANSSDYVATLRAFFTAHGNISDMAQILHVHANTCRYRLGRIAELFGVDLDDQDARLVLWLQLRLRELSD